MAQVLLGQQLIRRGDETEGLSLLCQAITDVQALIAADPLDTSSWR
jgi:hypothetical protein